MSEPIIRPYKKGDEDAACKVIHDAFDEYGFTWEAGGYNSDTEDIQAHYIDKGGWFWVMELDGEVIATVGLMPEGRSKCELWRMYLKPEHRGKGYGYRLLQNTIEFAQQQGFVEMEIWSDVKLIDAHRLYRKAGAEFIGQRLCDDPDVSLENGYVMRF